MSKPRVFKRRVETPAVRGPRLYDRRVEIELTEYRGEKANQVTTLSLNNGDLKRLDDAVQSAMRERKDQAAKEYHRWDERVR